MKIVKRGAQFLCVLAAIAARVTFAQNLSGTVANEQQSPLPSVTITIPALHQGTVTNPEGEFIFEKIPSGIYTIQFNCVGYKKETRVVNFSRGDATLNVVLHVSPLQFSGVTVTATPQPTDALTTPQAVTVLESAQLNQLRGQTVIQSLELFFSKMDKCYLSLLRKDQETYLPWSSYNCFQQFCEFLSRIFVGR